MKLRYLLVLSTLFIALSIGAAQVPDETRVPREIAFEWVPPDAPTAPYNLPESQDQHRIVIYPGVEASGKYPVVFAFHGQPRRGVSPRNYKFVEKVKQKLGEMIESKKIPPVILVLPVFRFLGQNWPQFDMRSFRREIESRLRRERIIPTYWLAFGHSGAAGCGGEGLNQVHRMYPRAVGFFDTCLGTGWQKETKQLQLNKIETIIVHSVETAGFKPKQTPEYQSNFDFGKAYEPLGLVPVECPENHPGEKLRDQPYKCAATGDRVVKAFVVDTGEGEEAHNAVLPVAIEYFLKRFVKK